MAEILTCHSGNNPGETHFVNDGSVPLSVPVCYDSEPTCTVLAT